MLLCAVKVVHITNAKKTREDVDIIVDGDGGGCIVVGEEEQHVTRTFFTSIVPRHTPSQLLSTSPPLRCYAI
jgi:hypothetical protein